MGDRNRRRQIIAKLAQKRKQYQTGIGKAERESFQRRIKTSIIRHKQQKSEHINSTNYAIKPVLIKNGDAYEKENEIKEEFEEEHKSVSISTSISPIRHQHVLQNKNMNNIKSPSISPKNL